MTPTNDIESINPRWMAIEQDIQRLMAISSRSADEQSRLDQLLDEQDELEFLLGEAFLQNRNRFFAR